MLHLHLGLSEGAEECYFLCWAWKKEKEEEKRTEKEGERKRLLQRPLGIGLWLCSRRATFWSERRKEVREGGFHFPSYRSPNSYSHCQGGNSQSGTHLGQNSPKTHKNMITEPLSLQRTLHSLEEGTNFNDMGRKPSVVCLHLCGARVKGDVWKETSVERWRKVREGWRELYVWGERGR